jgi:integration host factor subunit beta
MTKEELVNHVAATTDLPQAQAATVVKLFVQCIIEALAQGDKVEVRGFGSFRLRHRRARAARNPRTGVPVPIPAKRVPWFTPGKALRALMNAQAGAPVEP